MTDSCEIHVQRSRLQRNLRESSRRIRHSLATVPKYREAKNGDFSAGVGDGNAVVMLSSSSISPSTIRKSRQKPKKFRARYR